MRTLASGEMFRVWNVPEHPTRRQKLLGCRGGSERQPWARRDLGCRLARLGVVAGDGRAGTGAAAPECAARGPRARARYRSPVQDVRLIRLPLESHFHPTSMVAMDYVKLHPTIEYTANSGRTVRVSFDRWDALRFGRGWPYSREQVVDVERMEWMSPWFFVVEDSPWLPERHAHMKERPDDWHRNVGSVEDMLTDFSHYVLCFPRECIEVIAAGIWFEHANGPFEGWEADHPLKDLGPEHRVDAFTYKDDSYEIRQNRMPLDEIRRRAQLCEQPLAEFLCQNPRPYVLLRLTIRERDGATTCILRWRFGGDIARYRSIPSLDEVCQVFLAELDGIESRRRDPSG